MSASNNFITRPVLSTVCSLLIVIVGLIAIPILPIENLPDIAPPTVKVQATYVGADAVAVEQGVTSVLEQQINGVENMDFITSNSSSDGVSSISVSFDSGTDGNINQVNVQNRVSLAEPQLPEEVRKSGVTVNKASNSILLVYNFVNEDPSKTEYSVETISGYLDKNLTDNVKRVKGVGDVTYFGNRKIAFRLWLDPEKLTANNLSATDVVNQLRSQNRLVPAGKIGGAPAPEGQEYTFTVQLQGRLTSTQEFENIILAPRMPVAWCGSRMWAGLSWVVRFMALTPWISRAHLRLALRSISSPAVTPSRSPMASRTCSPSLNRPCRWVSGCRRSTTPPTSSTSRSRG